MHRVCYALLYTQCQRKVLEPSLVKPAQGASHGKLDIMTVVCRSLLIHIISKKKHQKCDEEKPTCRRCTSNRVICDGYTSAAIPKKRETPYLPLIAPRRNDMFAASPRQILIPGDPLESFSYVHFFTNTTLDLELSQSLDRRFWREFFRVPSQNDSSIRHALMALGAAHWQFTKGSHYTASKLDCFALRHYNEAISMLTRDETPAEGQAINVFPVLSCCFIFVLLESLRGNFTVAIQHIKSGIQLITDHTPGTSLPNRDMQELAAMFHAISTQVAIFSDTRVFPDVTQFIIPMKKYTTPSGKLRDLDEAEDVLNSFDDVLAVMEWDLDQDWEDAASECNKLREILRQRVEIWHHQFTAIVNNLAECGQYQNHLERIVNLKIQQKLWEVLLNQDCLTTDDDDNGDDDDDPKANLSATECKILLDDLDQLWSNSKRPHYGLKTDLIAALFQLYVYCADQTVRRRVIYILRSRRRREILWDSVELADFLEMDMMYRALGIQKKKWPDIGPSLQGGALLVFRA
jgi:hypothetical protein